MPVLDIMQFRDMFAATRSMAVVGNASTVLAGRHGARIDAHDMVVRFNRAHVAGLEDRIGARTDVLVANDLNALADGPAPAATLAPRCIVCFVAPSLPADVPAQTRARRHDFAALRAWAGEIPLVITFGPDPIGLPALARTQTLTSGTYALYAFLRLFAVERLFVTGFTMFGAVAGGGAKYFEREAFWVGDYHDLDQEAHLLAAILAGYRGRLEATPEVEALIARYAGDRARALAPPERQGWAARLLNGLAWRTLRLGMRLRRASESVSPWRALVRRGS